MLMLHRASVRVIFINGTLKCRTYVYKKDTHVHVHAHTPFRRGEEIKISLTTDVVAFGSISFSVRVVLARYLMATTQ